MKITVIIPVYKTSATLQRCLQSVASQTYRNLEIILVDDGSPDDSATICDNAALRDGRIKVIHKKNGGLSDARNAGLNIATGDYITFVDSDDELAPDTYAPLIELLYEHPEYDVLEYSVEHHTANGVENLTLPDAEFTDLWNDYWLMSKAYTHTYAWNKLFRRSLFSNLRFEFGRKFEDSFLMPEIIKRASTIATTSRGLYIYHYNPRGITATANGLALRDLLEAHTRVLKRFPNHDADRYFMYVVNVQLDVFHRCGERMLHYRRIDLSRFSDRPTRLKALVLNLLGMRILCRLHSTLKMLRAI